MRIDFVRRETIKRGYVLVLRVLHNHLLLWREWSSLNRLIDNAINVNLKTSSDREKFPRIASDVRPEFNEWPRQESFGTSFRRSPLMRIILTGSSWKGAARWGQEF